VSSLPASRTRTPSPCATTRVHRTASTQQRHAPSSIYHPFSCPHLDFVGDRSLFGRYTSEQHDQLLRKTNLVTADPPGGHPGNQVNVDDAPTRSGDGYVRFSRTDISAAASVPSDPNHATPKSSYRYSETSSIAPASAHEYEYPVVLPATGGRVHHRDAASLPATIQQVSLPRRKLRKSKKSQQSRRPASARARCVYCQELFLVAENGRGSCPDAPDECASCVERATCVCAARALLYHCATDDDGNYGPVCGGGTAGDAAAAGDGTSSERHRRRKWLLVALLSVVLPCLWCYPALTACHRCAVRHGHCGARHRAA